MFVLFILTCFLLLLLFQIFIHLCLYRVHVFGLIGLDYWTTELDS